MQYIMWWVKVGCGEGDQQKHQYCVSVQYSMGQNVWPFFSFFVKKKVLQNLDWIAYGEVAENYIYSYLYVPYRLPTGAKSYNYDALLPFKMGNALNQE